MTFNRQAGQPEGWRRLLIWLPIIAGLIVLYLPSLVDLLRGIWSTDQQAHGPIVLGIA
ncbi:MAG: exosortase B, partial [Nitrosomonadaceae bacterium]